DRARRIVRPTRAILQRQFPFRRPPGPLAHGTITEAEAPRDGRLGLAGVHALGNQGSTVWRGAGILMDVHPGRLLRVDGRLATTTFAETLRLDNLLRLHSYRHEVQPHSEGEYVLWFGRSLRDYDTFFDAMEKVTY